MYRCMVCKKTFDTEKFKTDVVQCDKCGGRIFIKEPPEGKLKRVRAV